MEGTEGKGRSGTNSRISRREILRYATAMGAGALLAPAIVSAQSVGGPTAPGSPEPRTQLPDTQEGALQQQRQMIEACAARGNALPADMPSRPPYEAVQSCLARRQPEEQKLAAPLSPLHQLLAATPLAESRLGLSHWQMIDEAEDLNLGHFRFPMSPYDSFADDGNQSFILLGNYTLIGDFRGRDYLEHTQRRMFDRGVWATTNGCQGRAVVEFDRPMSPEKVSRLVRVLYQYGIRTITWGNELNDPNTPWRDNLPELVKIFTAASDARKQYNLEDLEFTLPGLAYYGNGEYLQKMLQTFGALLPSRAPGSPIRYLPFQRVVDHYYGPVDGFLQRLTMMRQTMAKNGMNDLKFDLAEVGNPTLDGGQQPATDQQVAEGYIPQVTSLAVASGMMDQLFYYSLLDNRDGYSLVGIQDGSLVKKPSYYAFITMAKLLSRLSNVSWTQSGDTMRVDGSRTDGIDFTVTWSMVPDRDVAVPVPPGKRVFDSLGQEVREANPQQVTLPAVGHPSLGGPARFLVSKRS